MSFRNALFSSNACWKMQLLPLMSLSLPLAHFLSSCALKMLNARDCASVEIFSWWYAFKKRYEKGWKMRIINGRTYTTTWQPNASSCFHPPQRPNTPTRVTQSLVARITERERERERDAQMYVWDTRTQATQTHRGAQQQVKKKKGERLKHIRLVSDERVEKLAENERIKNKEERGQVAQNMQRKKKDKHNILGIIFHNEWVSSKKRL